MECDLCKKPITPSEAVYLDLYVKGSEGITVCPCCRVALTDFARCLRFAAITAHKEGYKSGKKERVETCNTGSYRGNASLDY